MKVAVEVVPGFDPESMRCRIVTAIKKDVIRVDDQARPMVIVIEGGDALDLKKLEERGIRAKRFRRPRS